MDEVKPAVRLPTVEHREPYESRGSRTVLGAPGGEIPPGDSPFTSLSATQRYVCNWVKSGSRKSTLETTRLGPNQKSARQANSIDGQSAAIQS